MHLMKKKNRSTIFPTKMGFLSVTLKLHAWLWWCGRLLVITCPGTSSGGRALLPAPPAIPAPLLQPAQLLLPAKRSLDASLSLSRASVLVTAPVVYRDAFIQKRGGTEKTS